MTDNTNLIILPTQNGDCKLVRNGLEIAPGLSFEQWENIGVTLDFMAKSLQFAIGDWINYGEAAYGEKYAQAVSLTAYEIPTLINMASVALNVPMSLRRDNLKYSHHVEVAYLNRPLQEALLDEAQERGLTVRELRLNVKAAKNGTDTNDNQRGRVCSECGRLL